MKDIRRGLWLIAIGISMLLFSTYVHAEENVRPKNEWVKGGVAAKSNDGRCFYKPFIKVGETEDDDEGNPQVIGYTPGNVQVSRLHPDQVIWERVYEVRFVRLGFPARGCSEKCPHYDE